jgi:oligoribonuclease
MRHLIFVDLETTGLDENKDKILELAMVAVALPRFDVVATFVHAIRPPMLETVKRNVHDKVQAMHTSSGLWADVERGTDAHIVEGDAIAFVRCYAPHTPVWHTPMAGANPDFDRRFLRKQMPKLHAAFHYRNFDVRAITQLQDWVMGQAFVESPHRALPDCLQAIKVVRDFLGVA